MQTISTRHFFFGFFLMMLATLFLLDGMRGLLYGNVFTSIITSLCGIFVLTFSEGTELNKQECQYRHFYSLFFFRTGEWMPLPEISHFEIIPHDEKTRLDANRYKIAAKLLDGENLIMGYYKSSKRAHADLHRLNKFWAQ